MTTTNDEKDDQGAGLIHQPIPDMAGTEPSPNIEVARRFIGLMREAFNAGFNAGWDADGTPLTFTERMDEEWREFENRVPPLKIGSVSVSDAERAATTGRSAAPTRRPSQETR